MPTKKKGARGGLRNPPGGRPRTNGREVIPFRLKPDLAKALRIKARKSGLSVSAFVERLVETDLKSESKVAQPVPKKKIRKPVSGKQPAQEDHEVPASGLSEPVKNLRQIGHSER